MVRQIIRLLYLPKIRWRHRHRHRNNSLIEFSHSITSHWRDWQRMSGFKKKLHLPAAIALWLSDSAENPMFAWRVRAAGSLFSWNSGGACI
jgi:hypothetical protein